MAKRRMLQRWCDRCGSTENLTRISMRKIEDDESYRQVTIDHCDDCGKRPLSEWESMIPQHKDGPRRRGRLVVDEEEVNRAARRRRKVG